MWARIHKLPNFDHIKALYNDNFPLEVRFVCAQWIEDRIKTDQYIDLHDPQYDQRAANFLQNLIQQLEQEKVKYKAPDQVSILIRLENAIRTFTQHIYNPGSVYRQIREALNYEQQVLDSFNTSPHLLSTDGEVVEINEKLRQIKQATLINTDRCTTYKHEFEQTMISYTESTKRLQEGMATTPEEQRANLVIEYKQLTVSLSDNIKQRRNEISNNIRATVNLLDEVEKIVIHKRLGKWQRDQALNGNGGQLVAGTLDEIQSWFELLADNIWNTRSAIDVMRKSNFNQQGPDPFDSAYREVTNLLQNLIVSGFIVEKQPPQVMKTNTR